MFRRKRLKHIDISSYFLLTCMAVKHIADKCQQLQYLNVSFCQLITGDIINIHSKLRHIEELRLDYQNFSARWFLSIPVKFFTLSVLNAKQFIHFGPCVIKKLETKFPNLKLIKEPNHGQHDQDISRLLCVIWWTEIYVVDGKLNIFMRLGFNPLRIFSDT
jgi:hypothetical protein